MRVRNVFLPLVALLGALATAQNYTAHPIDNLNSSTSQNIPFAGGSTSWDEARSQFLWTAPFLPTTGGTITAIEVVHVGTNPAFPYERFELFLDHTTNATLSTTFANNLTSPTLVFSRNNTTVSYTTGVWQPYTLDVPFAYDGTRNLVLEVRKKVNRPLNPTITPTISQRVLVYPRRAESNLPPPIWAFGAYGSGMVDAATASTTYNTQVLVRFQWGPTRTSTINSTRDTTGNANRSYYHLGATATITTQGTPGESAYFMIDVGLSPVGIATPPVNGEFWLQTLFNLYFIGVIDVTGRSSVSLSIPNEMSLVGTRVYFQSLTAGLEFNWTNVVDAVIAVY
jgi:hypothetical protein